MIDSDSDNDCPLAIILNEYECECSNNCPLAIILNECKCYNDCNFTFKDEVNITYEFYDKRKKNIVMYSE